MKKKAVEKTAYLTPEKCSVRGIKFVAAAGVRVIRGEKHLILDIYKNRKDCLDVPVMRFAYTKKEWGHYRPEERKWSACGIRGNSLRVIWNSETRRDDMETYLPESGRETVRRFAGTKIWKEERWWEYLEYLQRQIYDGKRGKHYERRRERLKARCAAVPELPDGLLEWCRNALFAGTDYIYYKRKGRYATFWCSHCGKEYTAATQRKDGYAGMSGKVVDIPRGGDRRICEKCGTEGICKPVGRMKKEHIIKRECYTGQPYWKTGAVSRYMQIEKILTVGQPERFEVTEIARSFFHDAEKRITDYHLYSTYTGENEWCDHNIGGMGAQIRENPAEVYPGTYEALRDTDFRYCALREYAGYAGKVGLADYLDAFRKYPQMEHLVKAGLYGIVEKIVGYGNAGILADGNADRPEEALGIRKNHMRLLQGQRGDTRLLNVLRAEKEAGTAWTDEQCRKLELLEPDRRKLCMAMQHMTAEKFLNRVQKYAGTDIEILCSSQENVLGLTAQRYLDYLEMREMRGYDMSNTVYLFPKDLEEAHRKMAEEINSEADRRRKQEADIRYPEIARSYRRYRKKYFYEDGDLFIRPARSAGEIIEEGRALHHCVGSEGYLKKHNAGESIILMVRFKKMPDTPYITVEIQNGRIVQWYGENDRKTDEKNMEQWFAKYKKELGKDRKTAEETKTVPVAV